jgi:hypothetical protein
MHKQLKTKGFVFESVEEGFDDAGERARYSTESANSRQQRPASIGVRYRV